MQADTGRESQLIPSLVNISFDSLVVFLYSQFHVFEIQFHWKNKTIINKTKRKEKMVTTTTAAVAASAEAKATVVVVVVVATTTKRKNNNKKEQRNVKHTVSS